MWGVLKQCHVADFETYVLVLYTALQNLLPAHYFIPPIAKTGNLSQVSYFSVWQLVAAGLVFCWAGVEVQRAETYPVAELFLFD